jgi:glutamine synthetase
VSAQSDAVQRTIEERDIRFIRLWFTDVQGFLKSFSITPAELDEAFGDGLLFDGSVIEGYARAQEADMLAVPDPNTFELLPWVGDGDVAAGRWAAFAAGLSGPAGSNRVSPSAMTGTGGLANVAPDGATVARMFCDVRLPSGEPFSGDPRYVLRRNLERARRQGFTLRAGPEMEFFVFRARDDSPPRPDPIDQAGYFDQTATETTSMLRRRVITTLEAMGIPVEYSHHEIAPGQQEIDLRPAEGLAIGDSIMTFRTVVKEVARAMGVHATFMPKPLTGVNGSGMHTHLSLFEGDQNAFADRNDPGGLSEVGRGFIAGLLRHARAITAVTNPWVNSYKRLVPGFEAPVHVCWARNNRSALVRVPTVRRGRAEAARLEYRAPDPACNPYLAMSVVLAAGLDGIERGLVPPPEALDNLWELDVRERRALGIDALPASLEEALDEMERSELVAEALGEHVFAHLLANKRAEWRDYAAHVTDYELDHLLGLL